MNKTVQVDTKKWTVESAGSEESQEITFIGAIPGTLGYGGDGTVFEYGPGAHFLHVLDKQPIVDLNHHQDEVIGAITATSVTDDGRLRVTIKLHDKYSYLNQAILDDKYDGVSIESIPLSGQWLDDFYFRIDSYVLTGIAVLIAKPPSCEKGACNVISQAPTFLSMLTEVDNNTEDQNIDLLLQVSSSLSTTPTIKGNNMCNCTTTTTDHTHSITTESLAVNVPHIQSNSCQCQNPPAPREDDPTFKSLSRDQLEKIQKIIAERLAPGNTTNSESDSNLGEDMSKDEVITEEVELTAEIEADAEVVVESADAPEETVESAAPEEVVAETPEDTIVESAAEEAVEPEAPEVVAEVPEETVASEAVEINMDDYVAKDAHDAIVAERDSLTVAHSALMKQIARLAPEDSLDKATLKAASEFVPGYDAEVSLYEQSGEIVAKVLSFSAVTSSVKAESTSAGAKETTRVKTEEQGTAPIRFNGLTDAAEWAAAKGKN